MYAWCLTRFSGDADQLEEWKRSLNEPIRPNQQPSEAQLEEEGEAFLAFMGQHRQIVGG